MLRIVLLLAAAAIGASSGARRSGNTASHSRSAGTSPRDTAGYIAVTVGDGFACAINTRNDAYCWGLDRGTLGAPGSSICGTAPCSPVPQLIPGGIKFKLIGAGSEHVCGISLFNKLFCWGSNTRGQLGIGDASTASSYIPLNIHAWHYFDTLSVGANHACARAMDTTATFCWGDNQFSQLGNPVADACASSPTLPCSIYPVPIITSLSFRAIEAGLFTTCGIDASSKVYCWGSNQMLGFGNGDTFTGSQRTTPKPISGGRLYAALSDGATHACALEASGAAWCWGNNSLAGQLGNGSSTNSPIPVAVVTGVPFVKVSASHGNAIYAHGCALDSGGLAYCWGSNSGGQLGVASVPSTCSTGPCSMVPIAASGGLSYVSISAGLQETCGIAYDGHAYCWGKNNGGQLGDGSLTDSSFPVRVLQF